MKYAVLSQIFYSDFNAVLTFISNNSWK